MSGAQLDQARPAGTAHSGQERDRLVRDADRLLGHAGVEVSVSRLRRLARTYQARVADKGIAFPDFLVNSVRMDAEAQRRVISYRDPTGETAVRNVMRGDR